MRADGVDRLGHVIKALAGRRVVWGSCRPLRFVLVNKDVENFPEKSRCGIVQPTSLRGSSRAEV